MKRMRIFLALGVVAIASSMALEAATALAEPVYFASPTAEYPETAKAAAANMTVLEAGKDTVSCEKVEVTGKLAESATTIALSPSYGGCKATISGVKVSATITPGSCTFELSKLEEGAEKEGVVKELTGLESIGGTGCGAIVVKAAETCTFEIPPQGPATGTAIKPTTEGTEVTSEFSSAKAVATKGCGESLTPVHIWIIVAGVWRLYTEFVSQRLSFWNGGVMVGAGGLLFTEGQEATIEVRNTSGWPLYYFLGEVAGNMNWLYFNIAGEPGTFCYKVFYPRGTSCRFKLRAPAEKPAEQKLKAKGVHYFRGELLLKTH